MKAFIYPVMVLVFAIIIAVYLVWVMLEMREGFTLSEHVIEYQKRVDCGEDLAPYEASHLNAARVTLAKEHCLQPRIESWNFSTE